ncbi:MAG: hypothetical protein HYV40_00695 [Candidatus Levybacteria bacterium]|nr:hypothetical protein [Candidatus Levybacteria bacterium]
MEAIGPLDPGIVYVAPDQIYDTTDPYKLIVEDGITKGVAINAAILKPLPAEQQIRVLQEGQLMAALHRIKINEQTKHDPDIIALNTFLDAYQNAYDMAESTNS